MSVSNTLQIEKHGKFPLSQHDVLDDDSLNQHFSCLVRLPKMARSKPPYEASWDSTAMSKKNPELL